MVFRAMGETDLWKKQKAQTPFNTLQKAPPPSHPPIPIQFLSFFFIIACTDDQRTHTYLKNGFILLSPGDIHKINPRKIPVWEKNPRSAMSASLLLVITLHSIPSRFPSLGAHFRPRFLTVRARLTLLLSGAEHNALARRSFVDDTSTKSCRVQYIMT